MLMCCLWLLLCATMEHMAFENSFCGMHLDQLFVGRFYFVKPLSAVGRTVSCENVFEKNLRLDLSFVCGHVIYDIVLIWFCYDS